MNMSYCRFQNTYNDLCTCRNALEDFIQNDENCISSEISPKQVQYSLERLSKEN